jgi:hypothetical protein
MIICGIVGADPLILPWSLHGTCPVVLSATEKWLPAVSSLSCKVLIRI